ncbi:MAG: MlaD family protein [Verrucomicrobiota bacterium]|jgi:phospholipid/cholesterol/gamma-HCH transport system substrate-binding protein|nr:MAG: MCE family protein [Verrucomicrobiota bacterium]
MNNSQQTARVGLFFLLGLALIYVTYETLSGGKTFSRSGYTVVAGFPNLQDLKPTDDVRMAGVRIGSVYVTRLGKGRAEAVLQIDPQYTIPSDASATIVMAGIIGTDYISIDLGTTQAPALKDGAEIKTKITPDIASIMTQMAELGHKLDSALSSISNAVNGSGPDGGVFQKFNRLLSENQTKIDASMTNLQEITGKINRGEGTLGKLVNDSKLHDDLLAAVGDFKATASEAKNVMASAQTVLDQVKAGQGALGVLVYDKQAAEDLKFTLHDIRDFSDKISKGQGTLGKLINDDSLYFGLQGTLKKADRAMDGLNDSGPISAVGSLSKSLF